MFLEVVARRQATRETDGRGVTAGRGAINDRTARIGQAEQSCHLVVGFTRGVVDGGAQFLDVAGQVADVQQGGVASGYQQGQGGHREGTVV